MAVSKWYPMGRKNMGAGNYGWNDTYNVTAALMSGQYMPSITHEKWGDVSAYETTGTNYVKTLLTTSAPVYDNLTKELWFGATNHISIANATFDTRYIVFFCNTGVAGTSYLIGYIDLGEVVSTSAQTFEIEWGPNGILKEYCG